MWVCFVNPLEMVDKVVDILTAGKADFKEVMGNDE